MEPRKAIPHSSAAPSAKTFAPARDPSDACGMDIAIVGLPGAGKTSLFNALTRGEAEVGAYSSRSEPNLGVAHVADDRLDRLAAWAGSKRVTPVELRLADYPASFDASGIDRQRLQELAQMDALVLVARAFQNPAVPAPEGGVDADRDIETMQLELTYADLALIERRLERIEPEIRSLSAAERGPLEQDRALLQRLREALEEGGALRSLDLGEGERRLLASYQFATRRPLLILVNVDEDELPRLEEVEAEYAARHAAPGVAVVALSARIEAELAQMEPDEAAAFRGELGLPDSSPLERVIQETYDLLGVLTFLTASDREARAWTLPRGGTALDAAGRIHSDMERGFIRAEVARWDELLEAGSEAQLRRSGRLRTEGRDYVVQDGDVVHVLFNV
ncbi:MAG: redox-regulated ATPase YchF [Chloroflexi bacterium]|nr:redox-regulated ATPase YchF [Chloroflexota bacterium]